jgi:hypothetical protein
MEEAHPLIIIVEHDPMLYENAAEMVDYISHALADASMRPQCCSMRQGSTPSWRSWPRTADRV